ncbi:hypothetical protein AAFF_G00278640 [Aldrovandia affinis]|uniref:Uncharacterized protein n=1 Tax=Aldrovandia affinis TaxID=143900 RepID=A0AAD7SRI5_9TELE|nr:hypothetical protein AAFF_G00278640 [Aldrovandia affinis]
MAQRQQSSLPGITLIYQSVLKVGQNKELSSHMRDGLKYLRPPEKVVGLLHKRSAGSLNRSRANPDNIGFLGGVALPARWCQQCESPWQGPPAAVRVKLALRGR